MPNMKNEIIDDLIGKLEDYKGQNIYGADLSWTLFEGYNVDGSVTYSTYKATQWIKEHFDELGGYIESMKNNGFEIYDPFENPEAFMVSVYLEIASDVIGQCETVEDSWNEQLELNDKTIKKITQELEEQKE